MKRHIVAVAVVVAIVMLVASASFAGKTYQFTGKVLEVTATTIVVDKNGEKFEMAKDANTKVKGDLKVGAKVTVKYESRAAEIEVKGK
jgi:type 1 fimbria pilin